MFRSIGRSVEKRRTELSAASARDKGIVELVEKFLTQTFGDAAAGILVSAVMEKESLVVRAANKVAAQEIMFRSGELYRLLKAHGAKFERIVIR